jgi:hypothetical protein
MEKTIIARLNGVINWLKRAFYVTNRKGFSIGFDLRRGWLASYSETTGYIIPTFYRYAKLFKSSEAFDIATSAAHWLISIQQNDGSIIDFVGHHKKPRPRSPVVFNTGQALFGLLTAFRANEDQVFLESAHRAANWIMKKQMDSGLWLDSGFGARNPGAYYSHVTWPLFLVGCEIDNLKLIKSACCGLNAVISYINPNYSVKNWGFKPGAPAFTHTIAYTIEGMLEQGLLMGGIASRPFNVAQKIALKTIDMLERDNRLAGSYDENWRGDFSYICTPGNCQLALIYMRLYAFQDDIRYKKAAQAALQPIISKQLISKWIPSFIRGGIHASWPPIFGKYMPWLYPNWAAKYLADALMFKLYIENPSCFRNSEVDFLRLLELIPG